MCCALYCLFNIKSCVFVSNIHICQQYGTFSLCYKILHALRMCFVEIESTDDIVKWMKSRQKSYSFEPYYVFL